MISVFLPLDLCELDEHALLSKSIERRRLEEEPVVNGRELKEISGKYELGLPFAMVCPLVELFEEQRSHHGDLIADKLFALGSLPLHDV